MSEPSRIHNTVQVRFGGGGSGTISAAREAPLAQVVEEARGIWAEVRASGVPPDDNAGNDRLLERLRPRHQDFAVSFPVPFRWMVQMREFDARVFEGWVRKRTKLQYKDRKEFLSAQGEYLLALYRAKNPRAGSKRLARYRAAVQQSLEKDDKIFASAREEAEDEVRRLDKANDLDRRRRIKAFLLRQRR
jgi:hypothetical protein